MKKDRELVVQVDDMKKSVFTEKKLSEQVKSENTSLKLQLAKLTEQIAKEKLNNSTKEVAINDASLP